LKKALDDLKDFKTKNKSISYNNLLIYARQRLNTLESDIESNKVIIDWNNSLGSVRIAEVYGGSFRHSNIRAIKVMDMHPGGIQLYGREISILRMISNHHHRHIIECYGWMKVMSKDGKMGVGIMLELYKACYCRSLFPMYSRSYCYIATNSIWYVISNK
jgi:hypothetical protein